MFDDEGRGPEKKTGWRPDLAIVGRRVEGGVEGGSIWWGERVCVANGSAGPGRDCRGLGAGVASAFLPSKKGGLRPCSRK